MVDTNIIISNYAFLGDPIYWAGAAAIFLLLFGIETILLIMLAKRTHAILEFKAMISGKRLVLFFDDSRTVDWRTKTPTSGLIEDDDYGTFLVNEKGTYVDKKTRNILIPFSTSLAVGAPVKEFKLADDLMKVLGDEKELNKIRMALANDELVDERFHSLRESVNFSGLKSLANTLIPHNISAKINMEIAKRMKSFGGVNGKDIIVYTLIALGCIALMALVLYLTVGGDSGSTTNVINTGATVAKNATIIAG